MIHDFGIVWLHRDMLLSGLVNTVILSVSAALSALLIGALVSTVLVRRARVAGHIVRFLIDVARCTPFLLFAYIVYYGLPSLGLRFDNWGAGVLALIVYHSSYMAEIIGSAWLSLPRDPIEAGHAFGYSGLRLFHRIVMPPLAMNAAPVVGNQIIQIVKDSAFLTIIALPELTNAASAIQSQYFVPFAAFITAMLLYWALCLVVEAFVSVLGRMAEARR
ncbi:amino acid ABC transporter permease (plasmid) [Paraburkholderia sp. FT54]|uniref:amino acid ABC transporter permease n=1 Tax=Paraburkholderia sp. FT54 TaxID=3074437 RepID=UPI00287759D3|nr:amino acid ABC transporter permease [Paraburkholderia sp. FT54]WNC95283.1 amino acid ABC transporter permease [Paraburkholderia sp. FT54]